MPMRPIHLMVDEEEFMLVGCAVRALITKRLLGEQSLTLHSSAFFGARVTEFTERCVADILTLALAEMAGRVGAGTDSPVEIVELKNYNTQGEE